MLQCMCVYVHVTGAQGPRGPAGPQGATGADGGTGPPGATGPQGSLGNVALQQSLSLICIIVHLS